MPQAVVSRPARRSRDLLKASYGYGGFQIANGRSHSPVSWRTSNIAAPRENVVELIAVHEFFWTDAAYADRWSDRPLKG